VSTTVSAKDVLAKHPDAPRGKAVRLYLLRHGEPERRDLFYGHHDVALSDRGRAEAQAQAEALSDSGIVAVYASDLTRAHWGAAQVAARHGLTPTRERALREMHLGQLENIPYAEAFERFPELATRSYRDMLDFRMPGGGESVRDVAARVVPLVEQLVLRHADASRPGVVVYAHNTVTRLLLGQAAGLGPAGYGAFSQRYGAINRVDLAVPGDDTGAAAVRWDRATIAYANRDPHWRPPTPETA